MAAVPYSPTDNRFRSNGHLLTVPLFYERCVTHNKSIFDKALFSIDGRIKTNTLTGLPLIDARSTFVEMEDPTGLKWATTYLESYEHFKKLKRATWFKEELKTWNDEIETRLKMRALQVIQELLVDVEAPEGTRLSAAKYLAEKGWEKKQQAGGAGRPSNKAIEKKVKEIAERRSQEAQDIARMASQGLTLVKK